MCTLSICLNEMRWLVARRTHTETLDWDDAEGSHWQVSLRFALVGEVVRCTGFAIVSTDDQTPVTSTLVRSVPVGTLIDEVLTDAPRDLIRVAGLPPFNTVSRLAQTNLGLTRSRDEDATEERRRGRPFKYGADHYAEVARLYMEAPTRPTARVAAHFDVPRTRAANWVRTAREMGLLERGYTKDSDLQDQTMRGADE